MVKNLDDAANVLTDTLENLTSTQTSRTGHTAARVASSLANNVDRDVLALQMTKNIKKNNPENPVKFTGSDMDAIAKLHQANRTRSALTKKQTGALIREQQAADQEAEWATE